MSHCIQSQPEQEGGPAKEDREGIYHRLEPRRWPMMDTTLVQCWEIRGSSGDISPLCLAWSALLPVQTVIGCNVSLADRFSITSASPACLGPHGYMV